MTKTSEQPNKLTVEHEWVKKLLSDLRGVVANQAIIREERIFAQSILDSYPNKDREVPGIVYDMWVSTKCHTDGELMELTKDGAKSPEDMGFVRVDPNKQSVWAGGNCRTCGMTNIRIDQLCKCHNQAKTSDL